MAPNARSKTPPPPTTSSSTTTAATTTAIPRSPFFRPSTPSRYVEIIEQQDTPRGTHRRSVVTGMEKTKTSRIPKEHKSTILGCTCNLVNAIVGSGIVGIPFAIQQAGWLAGIVLIVLCAIMTEKSLRLLLATAKHVNAPSYETLLEAAFGRYGFIILSANMFIMAYGAMISYLMIVKDTFSTLLGIHEEDIAMKRSIVVIISLLVMVPLSSQRDMADLAKTSRISVVIDVLIVLCVLYNSPIDVSRLWEDNHNNIDINDDNHNNNTINDVDTNNSKIGMIHYDTIFVGLGVLSFAYVCQHSAFIIAGSLERPTIVRWSKVTKCSLLICATLALICGLSGYLGYYEETNGNILTNLPHDCVSANIGRGMLGLTMLFVYPMESFVARHVCVVLFFQGRRAHEGEDTSVLHRRDRRIVLTVLLYILALVPALLFDDLGNVLAATGSVGGSCLSYIGPGIAYLGVHGEQFLSMVTSSWWGFGGSSSSLTTTTTTTTATAAAATTTTTVRPDETTSLLCKTTGGNDEKKNGNGPDTATTNNPKDNNNEEPFAKENNNIGSFFKTMIKNILWYLLAMPLWCTIAQFGEEQLNKYEQEMLLKSPHPLRIGNVQNLKQQQQQQQQQQSKNKKKIFRKYDESHDQYDNDEEGQQKKTLPAPILLQQDDPMKRILLHSSKQTISSSSFPTTTTHTTTTTATKTSQSLSSSLSPLSTISPSTIASTTTSSVSLSPSINKRIGETLLAAKQQKQKQIQYASSQQQQQQQQEMEEEEDPQMNPPKAMDFIIAIGFILFGVLAMFAGLFSIAISQSS